MSRVCAIAMLLLTAGSLVWAQEPAGSPAAPPPTSNTQQQNAASAAKDNSGISGDQITKPSAAKGSIVIGCLSGPDKEGKFMLRSMSYRTGVQVLGSPEDLKNDAGSKVKLTGQWLAPIQEQAPTAMHRFQVTDVEVVSPKCRPPTETTPVSQEKRGKTTVYDAPGSDPAR